MKIFIVSHVIDICDGPHDVVQTAYKDEEKAKAAAKAIWEKELCPDEEGSGLDSKCGVRIDENGRYYEISTRWDTYGVYVEEMEVIE